jgi:hypothetical protein
LPSALAAQIGVGAHVGSTGFGGDVAIALGASAQIRGSAGIMPIEPSIEVSGFDTKLELPKTFISAGIDFFPGGSGFRIGGGILLKPDEPVLTGTCEGNVDVGNQSYPCSQVGTATATTESKSTAPYVMIGFGRHSSSGIGLFLDLGGAFVGEQTLSLTADGPISGNATFQQELQREEQEWEDKINNYLKVYPILRLGLRVGIGG